MDGLCRECQAPLISSTPGYLTCSNGCGKLMPGRLTPSQKYRNHAMMAFDAEVILARAGNYYYFPGDTKRYSVVAEYPKGLKKKPDGFADGDKIAWDGRQVIHLRSH